MSTVRAGTLDEKLRVRPTAHYFMRSDQPRETDSGNTKCFDTFPTDVGEIYAIVAIWRTVMGASPDY